MPRDIVPGLVSVRVPPEPYTIQVRACRRLCDALPVQLRGIPWSSLRRPCSTWDVERLFPSPATFRWLSFNPAVKVKRACSAVSKSASAAPSYCAQQFTVYKLFAELNFCTSEEISLRSFAKMKLGFFVREVSKRLLVPSVHVFGVNVLSLTPTEDDCSSGMVLVNPRTAA